MNWHAFRAQGNDQLVSGPPAVKLLSAPPGALTPRCGTAYISCSRHDHVVSQHTDTITWSVSVLRLTWPTISGGAAERSTVADAALLLARTSPPALLLARVASPIVLRARGGMCGHSLTSDATAMLGDGVEYLFEGISSA